MLKQELEDLNQVALLVTVGLLSVFGSAYEFDNFPSILQWAM